MADVPDISPLKPVWPKRPDERPIKRRDDRYDGKKKDKDEEAKRKGKGDGKTGGGRVDEYV